MPLAAVLLCAAQALDYFYLKALKSNLPRRGIFLKTCASLCFLLIGAIALPHCGQPILGKLIFAGLLLGFAGDVVLDFRFLFPKRHDLFFALGMLLFGLGHLFYIAALLTEDLPACLPALPVCAALLLIAKIFTLKRDVQAGKLTLPGTVYIAITCFMGSLAAVIAVRQFSVGTMLFAIGGILFPVSDTILSAYSFGKNRRFLLSMLLHITYYLAQCLIAAAINYF